MASKEIFRKYKEFLEVLQQKILANNNFSLSRLINDNHMSDSAREALYSSNIIRKTGTGKGTKYHWMANEITNDLVDVFQSKIRIVNKVYTESRIIRNSGLKRNKLFAFISSHYSSFLFTDNGQEYVFELHASELSYLFCEALREFENFSLKVDLYKITLIFKK